MIQFYDWKKSKLNFESNFNFQKKLNLRFNYKQFDDNNNNIWNIKYRFDINSIFEFFRREREIYLFVQNKNFYILKSIRTTPLPETNQFIKLLFMDSFVLSPANRRNLKISTDWNETKRCVIFSLSPSFLFFSPLLSFFLAHSNSPKLPTKNGKLNRNPGHFPHVSSNYPPIGCGANDYCRVDNCRIQ